MLDVTSICNSRLSLLSLSLSLWRFVICSCFVLSFFPYLTQRTETIGDVYQASIEKGLEVKDMLNPEVVEELTLHARLRSTQ